GDQAGGQGAPHAVEAFELLPGAGAHGGEFVGETEVGVAQTLGEVARVGRGHHRRVRRLRGGDRTPSGERTGFVTTFFAGGPRGSIDRCPAGRGREADVGPAGPGAA